MPKQIKQHSIAKRAATDVTDFLQTVWPQTVTVHKVEADGAYQAYDVDLLWTMLEKRKPKKMLTNYLTSRQADRYCRE